MARALGDLELAEDAEHLADVPAQGPEAPAFFAAPFHWTTSCWGVSQRQG